MSHEMGADGAGRRLCARLPRGVGGNGRGGDAPAAVASLPAGDGARSVGAVRADGGERVRERLGAGDPDGTGCVERGTGEPDVGDAANTAGTELHRCRPGETSCYRLNQAACSPADGTTGVACYSNAEQAGDPRSVVYGRVARRPHKIVLEYWYFYYDDFYSYDYPPDDLFWQAHEGDWEVVSVVLDRGTQQAAVCGVQPALHGRAAGLGRRRAVGQPPGRSRRDRVAREPVRGRQPSGRHAVHPAGRAADPCGERPAGARRPLRRRTVVRPRVGRRGGCHRDPQGRLQAARLDPVRGDVGRGSGVPRSASDRYAGVPLVAAVASITSDVDGCH